MIATIRQHLAKRPLQRLANERARSPEIVDYRIRRAAGKLGWERKG